MQPAPSLAVPTAAVVELRITRPAEGSRPKRPATLLTYGGRLFSVEELLKRISERALYAAFEYGPDDPHGWWEAVCRLYPGDAEHAVSHCFSFGTTEACKVLPFRRVGLRNDRQSSA